MGESLLTVEGLKTYFYTKDGVVRAVDGVDFSVNRGQIVGLVGESGCGKSVTVRSLMRLIPEPPGQILAGRVIFSGQDLLQLPSPEIRKIRGDRIAMIFQDPMVSLNPTLRVGEQIAETLQIHRGLSRKAALERTIALFQAVNIPSPEERINDYPHQFSGGMRQRVMIAMALSCEPDLLIADEPTTALDVTVQAQILDLIRRIRTENGTAVLLITHDLGVVAELCDHVVVMYAGKIVEKAPVETLFDSPRHPYTLGLLQSIPNPERRAEELIPIRGQPPDLIYLPSGCSFAPRCDHCMERCLREEPPLFKVDTEHFSRCWLEDKPPYA